jgi:ferric-dicitrate binding protein FerR (iron transport regulator)
MQPDVLHISAPSFVPPRHQRASTLPKAVAAVLVLGVAIGTAIVWPRGVRVYAAGNDGLQVTLADDSRVEMRAYSEMTVGRASDGIQIDLKTGDIIVTAARQRDRHLYVRTKDMTVALSAVAHRAKAEVPPARLQSRVPIESSASHRSRAACSSTSIAVTRSSAARMSAAGFL